MKDIITLKAFAKINLTLDIVGKRSDGYHTLHSVMQTISIFDIITIKKTNTKDIVIQCDKDYVPTDNKNIAYKACQSFFDNAKIDFCGIEIDIKKNIPSGAGLAGGSADGAAVLVGLNKMFEANLSQSKLCEIGSYIGADVPFCIVGGTVLCEGIGDKLITQSGPPYGEIVVCKPEVSISTPVAYKKYDEIIDKPTFDYSAFEKALNNQDLKGISANLFNALEYATNLEEIKIAKRLMIDNGALGSIMSGSGSAVYGIFSDKTGAEKCYHNIKANYPFCEIAKFESKGIEIIE